MQILQPPHWPRPKGYSNGISASGRIVVTGGLVGWDENENFLTNDMAEQAKKVFQNIVVVLYEAGAIPSNIIRMTWYITNKSEYLSSVKKIGAAYREIFGKHYPAMAVLEVSALMEDSAKIEIEVTAVIPE